MEQLGHHQVGIDGIILQQTMGLIGTATFGWLLQLILL
jgi:hypothetical protein